MSRSLFDSLVDDSPAATREYAWKAEEPPSLDGITDVYLNFETTGLKWFDDDRPLSCAIRAGGRTWYLPWGHAGGNLCEATVKRWMQRELRGKNIYNINTRFDVHMGRVWGVDWEAQGNTVSDAQHWAALLDDHRHRSALDNLILDYLGETPMPRLDESRMRSYHAAEAAPRAMYNVEAIERLREVMWPMLEAEDLHRVRALEDRVIYVTCEMEKNGAPIDVELLDRWIAQSQRELEKVLMQIAQAVGFQVNPKSPKDMARVFKQLKLPVTQTRTGAASFTDAVLKTFDHPVVHLMRRAGKLLSLRSKYLVNTKKVMDSNGILRYALHQMRATKDDDAHAMEAGTVTGRFSSTEIVKGVGVNIQQRMKAARQRVSFGYDEDDDSHDDEIFLVRRLHIEEPGRLLLASDMDQAQYRIFASYANNPKVIAAYKENPNLSFHKFMWELIRPHASLTYRQQKDTNFAYLFGAGVAKMSLMLGHINQAEFEEITRLKQYDHPKLAPTKEVRRIYSREVPEIDDLMARAMHLAKPECDHRCRKFDKLHKELEHRGYVCTIKGRRGRFPDGQRTHKAFNFVDQGTEADYMKTKLVELHEARYETGLKLRITNHDEIVGGIEEPEQARLVNEILNRQSFPELLVPLTWSTTTGPNWADTRESDFQGLMDTRAQLHYENTGHFKTRRNP